MVDEVQAASQCKLTRQGAQNFALLKFLVLSHLSVLCNLLRKRSDKLASTRDVIGTGWQR